MDNYAIMFEIERKPKASKLKILAATWRMEIEKIMRECHAFELGMEINHVTDEQSHDGKENFRKSKECLRKEIERKKGKLCFSGKIRKLGRLTELHTCYCTKIQEFWEGKVY